MTLKIYLASRFAYAATCKALAERMTLLNVVVPDQWWDWDSKELDMTDEVWMRDSRVVAIANKHWRSIRECDALILVGSPDESRPFTGANIEVGYALALGKPVYSVGRLERCAMYEPVHRHATMDDLLDALRAEFGCELAF